MAFMGCRQSRSQLEDTVVETVYSPSPEAMGSVTEPRASESPQPIVSPSPMEIAAPKGCPAVELTCPPVISPMYCWAENEQAYEVLVTQVRGNQCAAINELAKMACDERVDLTKHRIRCNYP